MNDIEKVLPPIVDAPLETVCTIVDCCHQASLQEYKTWHLHIT
jgi:hypothetical protein